MYCEFDVCPHHKIAYLLLRKCGCSSIRHAISGIRDQQQIPARQTTLHEGRKSYCYLAEKLPQPESWFKFTLVRDPICRFLSFYSTKILNQNLAANHTFQNFHRFGLLPNMTIDQVLDVLFDPGKETEPHAVLQTQYLDRVGYALDYIGRLERLQHSLNQIANLTGVVLEPGRLNRAKQPHVLPTPQQFNRLVQFYRNDIDAFGYTDNYHNWYDTFVRGREAHFQLEAGFTFENEAKLLEHQVTSAPSGLEIHLTWRLHPQHSRKRVIRVGIPRGQDFEKLFQRAPTDLATDGQNDEIVSERIRVPLDQFPQPVDLRQVYCQLYFTDNNRGRALLTDYFGHDNMLLLPCGHLYLASKSSQRAA